MVLAPSCRPPRARRPGMAMVLLALLLVAILGMLGLVIDSGFLMASYRNAQNAADGAALAGAMELWRGQSVDVAKQVATQFVTDYNGLKNATVTVNIPPSKGPYAGDKKNRYVEVLVNDTRKTYFIQILGIDRDQAVAGRAVAGCEVFAGGDGAIVLDPNIRPGLSVDGGAKLRVNGAVIVNSKGAGLDQYGDNVDWGTQKYALVTSNNSTMETTLTLVKGGVDVVDNYKNYDPKGRNPLFARYPISPDPLRELPIPTDSNGVNTTKYGAISIDDTSPKPILLEPGIYEDIRISSGAEVTFKPGIYVFSPKKPNQGLRINGNPTITGNGVMFYVTGSTYESASGYGYWDQQDDLLNNYLDGPLPPTNGAPTLPPAPDPGKVTYATVDLNLTGAHVKFTGLQDANSPFNDVLFFSRRRNSSMVQIQGQADLDVSMRGTMYAKWGHFHLAGGGKYDAQFVVGSMSVSGQATVTIDSAGKSFGLAKLVYLVE